MMKMTRLVGISAASTNMTLVGHCILLSEKLCHLNLKGMNNLSGIGWRGVDLAEISAGPNSPHSASNKDQEHVLMFMRFERKNRTG
jgi:hypothetical protein